MEVSNLFGAGTNLLLKFVKDVTAEDNTGGAMKAGTKYEDSSEGEKDQKRIRQNAKAIDKKIKYLQSQITAIRTDLESAQTNVLPLGVKLYDDTLYVLDTSAKKWYKLEIGDEVKLVKSDPDTSKFTRKEKAYRALLARDVHF